MSAARIAASLRRGAEEVINPVNALFVQSIAEQTGRLDAPPNASQPLTPRRFYMALRKLLGDSLMAGISQQPSIFCGAASLFVEREL